MIGCCTKLTIKELAKVMSESFDGYIDPIKRQADIDWLIRNLENLENDSPEIQSIRAELFRIGIKHSSQM